LDAILLNSSTATAEPL